jgi:hypothetical protein
MSNILSVADVIALSTIIDAASQGAKVRWLDDDGNIRSGVARHIVRGASDFNFVGRNQDVRDAFLRITSGGLEITIAVRALMEKVHNTEFVIDK